MSSATTEHDDRGTIPHHRPFRFGVKAFNPPNHDGWVELARKVEALGYSTLSIDDHVGLPLAPVAAMAVAAEATTTLRVGSLVFANDFRHPVMLARDAATLDLLTCGRFEFGIGTGYVGGDYEMTGIPLDPPSVRVDRLIEAVQVIKRAFSGEPFSFCGKHYTVDNLTPRPAPVQRPHPPLLIGGGRRRMLQLAAREADIVAINAGSRAGRIDARITSHSLDATDQKVAWVREAAGDRLPHIELQTIVSFIAVTEDAHAAAEEMVERWRFQGVMTADDMLRTAHGLFGTEDQIVEMLQERRERFGISYITVLDSHIDAMAPVVARLAGR